MDNIGRIFGNGFGGQNFYSGQRKEKALDNNEIEKPLVKHEEPQVAPDKVFAFMGNNNVNINKVQAKSDDIELFKLSPDVEARITGFMQGFEAAFSTAKAEFGNDELALMVVDAMSERNFA